MRKYTHKKLSPLCNSIRLLFHSTFYYQSEVPPYPLRAPRVPVDRVAERPISMGRHGRCIEQIIQLSKVVVGVIIDEGLHKGRTVIGLRSRAT